MIRPNGSIAISFLWNEAAPELTTTSQRSSGARPDIPFPLGAYQQCRLCPRQCGFDRGITAHPRCGGYELRVATAGLSLGDEPMLRATRGSGVVMLSGCPLRCPSCHNPEMVADGHAYSIREFVDLAWALCEQGAQNLQILSPSAHWAALKTVFSILKKENFPIPIAVKSSGYESLEVLSELTGLVDIYIPDLKFGPGSRRAARAGASDYFEIAKKAILEMFRQVGPACFYPNGTLKSGVLVRHVRAPLPQREFVALMRWLASLPAGIEQSVSETFTELEAPHNRE